MFWFAKQSNERLRVDLLRTLPMLRRFLRSDWWPERINFGFTVYAFAVVVALLFLAPQDRWVGGWVHEGRWCIRCVRRTRGSERRVPVGGVCP